MAEALAEIIAEGERLEAELDEASAKRDPIAAITALSVCCAFRAEHYPLLARVAKAAVEWDEAAEEFCSAALAYNPERKKRMIRAEAALRAAVRGADEGGNDGR